MEYVSVARVVCALFAVWLIAVSVFMIWRPQIALGLLAQMASSLTINVTELLLRLVAGAAFITYADASRYPIALHVVGWFIAISSVLLLLVPRRWHAAYAVYWSEKLTPRSVQMLAPISAVAGASLIYAVN